METAFGHCGKLGCLCDTRYSEVLLFVFKARLIQVYTFFLWSSSYSLLHMSKCLVIPDRASTWTKVMNDSTQAQLGELVSWLELLTAHCQCQVYPTVHNECTGVASWNSMLTSSHFSYAVTSPAITCRQAGWHCHLRSSCCFAVALLLSQVLAETLRRHCLWILS